MSLSPNSALVQRTIDVHYANRKRSSSLKWMFVNALFFLVFVYDLSCKCPGHTSALHYVELCAAGALAWGAAHHALRLLPRRQPPLALSRHQQRLLGLAAADLDSSFVLSEGSARAASRAEEAAPEELSLSLSARWRPSPPASPPPSPPASHSPPAPRSPLAPATPPADRPRDRFISDRHSLSEYLKQYEERSSPERASTAPAWPTLSPPPPTYQLAALDTENSKLDESSPQGSPQVWWQLDLDPQRLTQWNLNLRLWIHVTILERLVRELAGERRHAALQPYLEPFPDQRYLVQRIRELAQGGCLSNYKWNGGGSDWDESKPTDAEIIIHLLATYLDGQMLQPGNPRPFSSEHLSAAPGAPPRGPRALALHRVARRPPHWALALGGATLEPARGRNNLLHALLLLLAAAARRTPPALARTHLGPAGLNMLWIIGR